MIVKEPRAENSIYRISEYPEYQKAYQLTVSALVDMVRGFKFFLAGALVLFWFTIGASKAAFFVHLTIITKLFRAPIG